MGNPSTCTISEIHYVKMSTVLIALENAKAMVLEDFSNFVLHKIQIAPCNALRLRLAMGP